MNEWERKARDEMAEAVRTLTSCSIRNEFNRQCFIEFMSREHRTHQQSVTGLMLEWFKYLASLDENHRYDLRNEASVKLAKKIIDAISVDGYVPSLPYY